MTKWIDCKQIVFIHDLLYLIEHCMKYETHIQYRITKIENLHTEKPNYIKGKRKTEGEREKIKKTKKKKKTKRKMNKKQMCSYYLLLSAL